ncbi:RNA-dependent RNA polymerase [Hippocampus erectus paramyxovirus 1]|nr:RNA-dependent RNA polymerase [Hippocampus erectus paramyxovirus 1]
MEEDRSIDGASLQDVIYPEAHLSSPLVLNKLIYYLTFARIDTRYTLSDSTLVRNIREKMSSLRGTPNRDKDEGTKYRRAFQAALHQGVKYTEDIYPEQNSKLFRLRSATIARKFTSLASTSFRLFLHISPMLKQLLRNTYSDIGSDASAQLGDAETLDRLPSTITDAMRNSPWYIPFGTWFQIKTWMRKAIKNKNRRLGRDLARPKIRAFRDITVITNGTIATIINHVEASYIHVSFEICLAITDTLEGRLMIDTAVKSDPKYERMRDRSQRLWETIDSLFQYLGNRTFDVVALLEPLTLSMIQMWDHEISLRGAFLHHCLDELRDILSSVFSGQELEDISTEVSGALMDAIRGSDPGDTAEAFSFFRTFSHPVLEATGAAEKVRAHMVKAKTINLKVLQQSHAVFCAMIINGFRDRNGGIWPPCTFPEHTDSTIRKLRDLSINIPIKLAVEHYHSFTGFRFMKFLEPKVDDDLTMYMKDKALAPDRSYWDSCYLSGSMRYKTRRNPGTRRLVERFVDDEEFDPNKILEYIETGEYLRDEEVNCSYSLKEKEVKKHGRLFAKMTYKIRAAQVMAEHFIAKGVGQYFPENAMVKDEQDLLKSIYQLSVSSVPRMDTDGKEPHEGARKAPKPTSRTEQSRSVFDKAKHDPAYLTDRYETIAGFITTDLEKYCLNWRFETTRLFAARLDEIYGFKRFFDWHHRILERLTLYVADPFCPPPFTSHIPLEEVPNEGLFIKNPLGGIEGYCQKMWTIITIAVLHLAAVRSGYRIEALVQGDNQAIAITDRVPEGLPAVEKKRRAYTITVRYFKTLRQIMWGIGHNLKANETIISTHFFVFSKRVYYDGVVLQQALKPLSRCCFWSETLVDETRSACSTLATSAAKSIENGLAPIVGYLIVVLKTMQQVLVSLLMSINPVMTKDITRQMIDHDSRIILAALIPSQLGGFNYLLLPRIFVRNIGDPITSSLGDIKRMIRAGLLPKRILNTIMNQDPGDSDWLDWGSDPYSANLPESQSITTSIKNLTGRFVLRSARNPVLKGLFTDDTEQQDRDIARFLLDRDIILPRVASEILDSSIVGAREEIAAMVDTTKTLVRTALRVQEYSIKFITKLNYHDHRQYEIFLDLINNFGNEIEIGIETCSVTLAIMLRARMWRKLAKHRPIQGLETPDILEFCRGHIVGISERECADRHVGREYAFFYVPANCELDRVSKSKKSLRVPYLGSTTEERSEIKIGNVATLSRPMRKAIRVATVYTWGFGDSDESWESAHALSMTRANISLENLKLLTPISTSTNLSHRLRDKQTQMKYSSTKIPRVSRYATISNDKLNFSENEEGVDTNIIYQQIMLLGLSLLEDKFRFRATTGAESTIFHLHARKFCCVRKQEDSPSNPARISINLELSCCENKLVYDEDPLLESDMEGLSRQRTHLHTVNFAEWPDSKVVDECTFATANTVVNIMANNESANIKHSITLDHKDGINGLISEFMSCKLMELWLYIGQIFLTRWIYQIGASRPLGKAALIESAAEMIDRSSSRIFGFLETVLTHEIIWRGHIDTGLLLPIFGHLRETQDFRRLICILLTEGIRMAVENIASGKKTTFRIYESDPALIEEKIKQTRTRYLMILYLLYREKGDSLKLYDLTQEERESKLRHEVFNTAIGSTLRNAGIWMTPDTIIYPASVTYLRRGTLKIMRLRGIVPTGINGTPPILASSPESSPTKRLIKARRPRATEYLVVNEDSFADYADDVRFERDYPITMGQGTRFAMLRTTGINSTSHYKMHELYQRYPEWFRELTNVMMLGEGSGAMAAYLLSVFPDVRVWYNTGVTEESTSSQRVRTMNPSEVEIVDRISGSGGCLLARLIRMFNGYSEVTWIGTEAATRFITELAEPYKMEMVTYDGEGGFSKEPCVSLNEHREVIKIAQAVMDTKGTCITKVSIGDTNLWVSILRLYSAAFNEVKVHSLTWSNPIGGEFFISARSLRTRPINIKVESGTVPMAEQKFMAAEQALMRLKSDSESCSSRLLQRLKAGHGLPEHNVMMDLGFLPNMELLIQKVLGVNVFNLKERWGEYLAQKITQTVSVIITYTETKERVLFEHYEVSDRSRIREAGTRLHYALFVLTAAGYVSWRKWSDNSVENCILRGESVLEWSKLVGLAGTAKRITKWLKRCNKTTTIKLDQAAKKQMWKIHGGGLLPMPIMDDEA